MSASASSHGAMLSLDAARAAVLRRAQALPSERLPLLEAAGRRLAEGVTATFSHPSADNAAMDGYAVRAEDLAEATAATPVTLAVVGESRTGHAPSASVASGQAVRIFTGGLLPSGADAVVVQEAVPASADGNVRCLAPVARGANVRRAGEEFHDGDELLPAGARLSPAAVGLLASAGVTTVAVPRRPRVALLVIGDELADDAQPCDTLAHRYDSNSPMIAAACREAGADAEPAERCRDDVAAVAAWLSAALARADVVITCGSASVGDHDVVAAAWRAAGIAAEFTRVAIKPGKPVRFGTAAPEQPTPSTPAGRAGVGSATDSVRPTCHPLVFALPGNPLACLTGFEQLVVPALTVLSGAAWQEPPRLRVPLAHDYRTGHDSDYLLRADLDGEALRVPARQGAAMLRDAATQPLVARLPGGETLAAGRLVEATLLPGALDGRVVQPASPAEPAQPLAISIRAEGSGAGKTLLIEQLLPALHALGLRVGTIKHAHHGVDPDVAGKDSQRHYAAGAEPVLLLGTDKSALFRRRALHDSLEGHLAAFAGRVELVLLEGFRDEPLPAVTVSAEGAEFALEAPALGQWRIRRPAEPNEGWRYPERLIDELAGAMAALAREGGR